ncbi:MCM family protein (plasmid) [Methanocaldococcus indicus]|uniref:MCM family protein n=1 Tax=Methanocaldococcus indicus TaxID=213231 RepID=UPI0039C8E07F
MYEDIVYKYFENERRKSPRYKERKYNKETEYKKLIKFLLDNEKVDEAELMLKAKEIGLGKLYLNAFLAIMRKHLGFIDLEELDGYKIIKISKELKELLEKEKEIERKIKILDLENLQMKYEIELGRYINKYLLENTSYGRKIKISMKELYNLGFMELVDYTLESMENYYQVKDWIEELVKKQIEIIFGELDDEIDVILYDFPKEYKIDINEISSKYVNKVVEFEGNIVYASPVVGVSKIVYYICPKCGKGKEKYFREFFNGTERVICECGEVIRQDRVVEYVDFQELIIQGFPNERGYAREQRVLYEDTQGVFNGYVKVTGIVRDIPKNKKNKNICEYVVQAINIEELEGYIPKLTEEDIRNIEKIAKRKDVIDLLAERLIPELKGYHIIKKAVFLQQVKAVEKGDKRGNINILLITDPGIGKTVILRKIAKIPGNSYINLPTSTINSIIGIAEKKTSILGESFTLKVGILPRTLGTACIDEFYVQNNSENKKLLEAMESPSVHIDKGGINAELPIRCAYLCACNPKYGRFDPEKSVAEQINIPSPLLSRFDLIFPLMDSPNQEMDEEIADYVADIHRAYLDEEINKKIRLDYVEVDGVRIDFEFIVKYIHYARKKKPILSDSAKQVLKKYYVAMRKLGESNGVVPIGVRQYEGLIRLSEAIAKAKLKESVDEEDAKEAIEIMDYCLRQIAYDPETGTLDIDKIAGTPKSERKKLDKILEAIKELSNNNPEILIDYENIKEWTGFSDNELERLLKKLIILGDIDKPKPGKYRLL